MGKARPTLRRTVPDRQMRRPASKAPSARRASKAPDAKRTSTAAKAKHASTSRGRRSEPPKRAERGSQRPRMSPESDTAASRWPRVYEVVGLIPRGKVSTYGQVARLAGLGAGARQVGYALSALPDGSRVPWHRVINRLGEISLRASGGHGSLQRILLEREGVRFDRKGRVDLRVFGWHGPRASK
jgi:methylated-DNA-protein-cysteine methyltransferase-like protein